ncbi:hypothetical protein [Thiomicrorhabdus sp.]|uniref:hypothetical protein n=1 Tax=Thiomicrorhabdus sp. TaxID=2039724 RepID=UPI003564894F
MNDQKITDDLLDELEQLEASAEALEEQVNQNKEKQEAFQKLDSANQIDALTLAVEAARTAQEAASQSHKAAETSISHANRQKAQIMELSEGNFAWRQATKVAGNELKSAKSSFAIMLSANVAFSVIAASAIGWMLYDMHKKQAQFKGEVLDIIQTENTLFNKQITIKVDQISSLLELLTAEIQRMKPLIQQSFNENKTDLETNAPQTSKVPDAQSVKIDLAQEAPQTTADATSGTESTEATKQQPNAAVTEIASQEQPKPSDTKSSNLDAPENAQYAEIKKLVEQILDEQQKLQAKTLVATQQGITEQQAKQLKDINWLVGKQSKTLNEIKQTLLKQPTVSTGKSSAADNTKTLKNYELIQQSLTELKAQLESIKAQQDSVQSQVKALQEETQKLNQKPKPYSYHLKE